MKRILVLIGVLIFMMCSYGASADARPAALPKKTPVKKQKQEPEDLKTAVGKIASIDGEKITLNNISTGENMTFTAEADLLNELKAGDDVRILYLFSPAEDKVRKIEKISFEKFIGYIVSIDKEKNEIVVNSRALNSENKTFVNSSPLGELKEKDRVKIAYINGQEKAEKIEKIIDTTGTISSINGSTIIIKDEENGEPKTFISDISLGGLKSGERLKITHAEGSNQIEQLIRVQETTMKVGDKEVKMGRVGMMSPEQEEKERQIKESMPRRPRPQGIKGIVISIAKNEITIKDEITGEEMIFTSDTPLADLKIGDIISASREEMSRRINITDKVVEVTGILKSITQSNNEIQICIEYENQRKGFFQIYKKIDISGLKKGDIVKVKRWAKSTKAEGIDKINK